MRNPGYILSACLFFSLALNGCGGTEEEGEDRSPAAEAAMSEVITFDLDPINEDGLIGPPNGLRSVMYEFCIPSDSASADEVLSIDPSLQLQTGSPGRIGCTDEQTLCIGDTHQSDWKAILERLAALEYVTRIDRSFME
jgi:hypothetical protein